MRNLLVRLIGENIDLKFCLDSNLGLIKMDPTQAQQVLLNLVLNARDAMPDGGQITIKTADCNVQMLADSCRQESCIVALRRVRRRRQRMRHGCSHASASVRTLFHDESRKGHRAWPGNRP